MFEKEMADGQLKSWSKKDDKFQNENRQEVIKPLPIFFFIGNSRKEERAERKNSDTLIFLQRKRGTENGKSDI